MKKKFATKALIPKLVKAIKSHMGGTDSIGVNEITSEFGEYTIGIKLIVAAVAEAGYRWGYPTSTIYRICRK